MLREKFYGQRPAHQLVQDTKCEQSAPDAKLEKMQIRTSEAGSSGSTAEPMVWAAFLASRFLASTFSTPARAILKDIITLPPRQRI